ncbi:hypothetical protein C3Y87_05815 [Carbonactinospora thermoautotrophica]|uniref:serine hydrolase domain-containing protein n=1 Tax=Carbonactinospora thermoautotrophica TaxID=1469144 RepID=UPI00226F3A70|nr:serine hydrolase domain-containing protein [Carbonactinospora thermoautotrophica]MCX9190935.1 hypothetical protein [Carbonactinospora thermoautotrophica]
MGRAHRRWIALIGALVAGFAPGLVATGEPLAAAQPANPTRPVNPTDPADKGTRPPPDPAGIRQALGGVRKAGAPGVFARVEDAHAGVLTEEIGVGNRSNRARIDPSGRFRIGSVTKTFTAVLVLQLVDEGKVKLDEPARAHLPAGVLPSNWPITVRHLLTHRSGLSDYSRVLLKGETVRAFQRIRYRRFDPKDLVAIAVKRGLRSKPGSAYQYSNTNYVLLGLLVEHVTGKPFRDLVYERIIEPLDLRETSWVVPETTIEGEHPEGYLPHDRKKRGMINATEQTASWIWSAGALISSAADLARYLRALVAGELVEPETLREMLSTQPVTPDGKIRYGLGLRELVLSCGEAVVGHDGVVQGYQNSSYTSKDGQRQVTIMANASNNSAVYTGLRRTLEPVFCGRPASLANQEAVVQEVLDEDPHLR